MTAPKITFTSGVYLYAIAALNGDLKKRQFTGIQEQPIYFVPYRDIVFVVSGTSCNKIRSERKNIAAHHAVLKQLMNDNVTILPMRFGVVAKHASEVRKLLAHHYTLLHENLKNISDRTEMGINVTWDVPNIFEYFIERYPELREARDALLMDPEGSSPLEKKIALGELFSHILTQEREIHTQEFIDLLSPICVDIVRNNHHNEMEVMNLACLIPHEENAYFEDKINEIANHFDDHFLIKFTGPWPPYNFAQFNLEL